MNPEEFERSLRAEVEQRFASEMGLVRSHLMRAGKLKFEDLRRNLGEIATPESFGDIPTARKVNALSLALSADPEFNSLMIQLSDFIRDSRDLRNAFVAIAEARETSAQRELVLKSILTNERLLTAPIRYIVDEPELRNLLELPENLSFSDYMTSLRSAISDGDSINDVVRRGRLIESMPGLLGASAGIVAVALAVTVAAVVHTVIAAVNYVGAFAVIEASIVFTAAGPELQQIAAEPSQSSPAISTVTNNTNTAVWIIMDDENLGPRRFPLPAGAASCMYGVRARTWLLIGGAGNPVQKVRTLSGTCYQSGVYLVNPDDDSADVTLIGDSTLYQLSLNKSQQRAEENGAAGFSEELYFRGSPLCIESVAATLPLDADVQKLLQNSASATIFHGSRRLAELLKRIQETDNWDV